jgi:sensor histidine kinase YesM
MQESMLFYMTLSRGVFLLSNLLLDYSFLTSRRPLWFQILAFSLTWGATFLLRPLLGQYISDPFLVGYMVGLLFLVPFALVFSESVHAKLFVFFMVYSLSQLNFLICLFLELLIFKKMVGFLILAGLLLELFSIPLVRKYVTSHVKNILEVIDQQNPSFTLFPILSFLFLAYYGVQRIYLLSTFIPLVFCSLLIAFTYYLIAVSIDQTKRQQKLKQQLALQRDHYRNLTDSITNARVTRHDLRHHLATLLEFLCKKDVAPAQDYLKRLCSAYDDSSIPTVCRNQAADALVCHYMKLAKQQGVVLTTRLNLPEDLGINDLDLCVILGNCLENALEACGRTPRDEPRFIDIETTLAKGHLLITMENSFGGILHQEGTELLSSKMTDRHGIGLSSVKALTRKYDGHFSFDFDRQIFKTKLSLRVAPMLKGGFQS